MRPAGFFRYQTSRDTPPKKRSSGSRFAFHSGKSLYVLTIFSRSHRAFRSKATSCQPKHLRTRILYYPVLIFEAMLCVVCRFQKCKAISHDLARSTDLFLISYLGHIALKPSAYLGLPAVTLDIIMRKFSIHWLLLADPYSTSGKLTVLCWRSAANPCFKPAGSLKLLWVFVKYPRHRVTAPGGHMYKKTIMVEWLS